MSKKDMKKAVVMWAEQVGKPEARRHLVVAGISPHTADKLVGNRYPSELGILMCAAVERAMRASKQQAS